MKKQNVQWKEQEKDRETRLKGGLNVGPNGGEARKAVRRDRRECRESEWEVEVQNRRNVKFETIQQQEGEKRRSRRWGIRRREEGEQEEGEGRGEQEVEGNKEKN